MKFLASLVFLASLFMFAQVSLLAQEDNPIAGLWKMDVEKSKQFMDDDMKEMMESGELPNNLTLQFGDDGSLTISMDDAPGPLNDITYTIEAAEEEATYNLTLTNRPNVSTKVIFLDDDTIKMVPEDGPPAVFVRSASVMTPGKLKAALLGNWASNAKATTDYIAANDLGEPGLVPELVFQFEEDGSAVMIEAGEEDQATFEVAKVNAGSYAVRITFDESTITLFSEVIDEDTVLLTPKGADRPILFQRQK